MKQDQQSQDTLTLTPSTGFGTYNMLDGFGFGSYSPAITFVLQPIYSDLLRIQAIEFNDQIRKSAYSFDIQNNN